MVSDLLLRIILASVFGALIGLERQLRAKEAGLRTHVLVCIGSALFMIVSKYGFEDILSVDHVALDPSRIAAQVVSGVGFLGAGAILINKQMIKGLTTAAGLWVTAALGLVVGSGMYQIAIYGTVMTLVVLEAVRWLRDRLMGNRRLVELLLLPEGVAQVLASLQQARIPLGKVSVSPGKGAEPRYEMTLEVTLSMQQKPEQIYQQLLALDSVREVKIH